MLIPNRRGPFARHLFNGIADSYHGPARLFSFFQYDRWHRYLVSQLHVAADARVLDVCTGTGLVARAIEAAGVHQVVGLDLSDGMLEEAQRTLVRSGKTDAIALVRGQAEQLPFHNASFDAVVFTYLLRYVDSPAATLRELARVLRPGGQLLTLEFSVPANPVYRAFWLLHTRLALPLGTRLMSEGWREVGEFLGPSITRFYQQNSLESLTEVWISAGLIDVRCKTLSFGSAVVMSGRKQQ